MDFKKTVKVLVFDFDGTLHNLQVDWHQARHVLGIEGTDESLGKAVDRLKKEKPELLQALDDVERTALANDTLASEVATGLQRLSATYRTAVLSRNSGQVISEFLGRHNVHPEYIVGRIDVDNMKPHPEGLEKVLRYFHCQPDEALVVGDTWHDLLLAQAVGCPCVIIGQNFEHENQKPPLQVANMQELEALLS